jgi:hypothetical protein
VLVVCTCLLQAFLPPEVLSLFAKRMRLRKEKQFNTKVTYLKLFAKAAEGAGGGVFPVETLE